MFFLTQFDIYLKKSHLFIEFQFEFKQIKKILEHELLEKETQIKSLCSQHESSRKKVIFFC